MEPVEPKKPLWPNEKIPPSVPTIEYPAGSGRTGVVGAEAVLSPAASTAATVKVYGTLLVILVTVAWSTFPTATWAPVSTTVMT